MHYLSPIDVERKGWFKKPVKRECMSVFDYCAGRIELYMDNGIIRSSAYSTKQSRTLILKEWELLMRNHYQKHIFHIHIIPKNYSDK